MSHQVTNVRIKVKPVLTRFETLSAMHYAIIANPASGTTSPVRKRALLSAPARILGANIYGLDTATAPQLVRCACDVAAHCDVLVIAGGDGTFSDIVNAIDTVETPVAFLPLGTGNALSYALGYKGGPAAAAKRIRDGNIREHDLLDCKGHKRGFMMSVGFEGTVLQSYDRYLKRGYGGFGAYVAGFLEAYFRKYRRTNAQITIDGHTREVDNLLSLMVVKQPYYGFGMNVVPRARFDDGLLHTLSINAGLFGCAFGAATAFAGRNQIGRYVTGHRVEVQSTTVLPIQIDGDCISQADTFRFQVIPKALRIKY